MRRADCEALIVPIMGDTEDLQEISFEELLEVARECGEIIVESGEVAQRLEACGFEIMNPNPDGSQFILRGKGKSNAEYRTGKELALSHVVQVNMEIDDEEYDFRTGPVANTLPQPAISASDIFLHRLTTRAVRTLLKEMFINSPSENPAFHLNVAKSPTQEAHACIEFMRAYTGPTDSCEEVQVHLMLKKVTFGVEECFNRNQCLGYFVHQLDIIASPKEAWKPSCTVAEVRPGDNPESVQRGQTGQLQLGLTMSGIVPGGQVMGTLGYSTGSSCKSHGWLPARAPRPRPYQEALVDEDKSVTWTWKLNTWSDGQRFDANQTSFRTKNVPKLPFERPEQVTLNDLYLENDATWKVPTSTADALQNDFMWDVRVRIHVTLVRSWLRLRGLSQCVLPREKSTRVTPLEFVSRN